ncbi:MAG: hypothetical protein IJK41_05755 [Muribaculaceae bacterium]|nr:hypothetical protein [Muribaculaceae bacterium]
MKKIIAFLAILMMFPMYSFADRYGEQQVILHHTKGHGGHLENYPIADMPDAVYYDSDEMEIIIVADGTSLYYNVEIVSDALNLTVISTQVDGYGDVIDVSSLPAGNYTIIITSQFLNEYEGQFTV